jgi:hypothetical protein
MLWLHVDSDPSKRATKVVVLLLACVTWLCCCVCPADGVLEGLLEHYMAELRSSATTSPCQQQLQQGGGAAGSISSEEGQTCGVCLDAAPTAMINPCEHTMCGECTAAAGTGWSVQLLLSCC